MKFASKYFATGCLGALLCVGVFLGTSMLTHAQQAATLTPSTESIPQPNAMLNWLRENPASQSGLHFELRESGWIPGKQLLWSTIDFQPTDNAKSNQHGRTLIVWSPKGTEPLWTHTRIGDYGFHSVRWIDFDGDGELDLLAMAGEEDYYYTELFLWRGKPMSAKNIQLESYNPHTMVSVFQSFNSYATVLDVNNDGIPEILDNGLMTDQSGYSMCEDVGEELKISPATLKSANQQYRKLAGRFARNNSMYDLVEGSSLNALEMLSPVRLIKFNTLNSLQVVNLPAAHIQWRIQFLQQQTTLNKGKCLQFIRQAIQHNQGLLKAAR